MRKLVLGLIAGSAAGLALTAAPQPARAQGLLGALLGLGSPTYGYGYGDSPYYGTGYSWGGQVSRYDPYSSYGYGYERLPVRLSSRQPRGHVWRGIWRSLRLLRQRILDVRKRHQAAEAQSPSLNVLVPAVRISHLAARPRKGLAAHCSGNDGGKLCRC